jgi:predicted secreted hydrolase
MRRGRTLARIILAALIALAALAAPATGWARSHALVLLPRDAAMHPGAQTEWWYFTGHLHDASGHSFGFEMVTFKFQGLRASDPRSPSDTGYRLDLAITDDTARAFTSQVDYILPRPGAAALSTSSLRLRLAGGGGGMAVDTLPGPGLRYRLRGSLNQDSLDVTLATTRRPLLEGGQGLVPMGAGGSSSYYSLTNLATSGSLHLGGRAYAVRGQTWMDHQWGNWQWRAIRGWDWMGVQLDDGTSVALSNFSGAGLVAKSAAVSRPDGTQLVTADAVMAAQPRLWLSPRTGARYPQGWRISVPAIGLEAVVTPTMAGQEVVDPLSFGPTYWEGSCLVRGTLRGKPIAGRAYTELVGYAKQAMGMLQA